MKTKIIKKAYKFRIYPTLEQISFFAKSFGCVRKVHNLMLDDRKKDYEEYKSTGIKTKYPTPARYKEEYPYLKEVDSLALANAQLNLEKAFKIRIFLKIKILVFQDINVNLIQSKVILQIIKTQYILKIAT